MSNEHGASTPRRGEPPDRKLFFSALGWVGFILLFVLIVFIAYLPTRAPSTEAREEEERFRIRNEVRGEQARLVNAYGWENEADGIVRLAIDDHLFRITLEELRETNEAKLSANAE